MQLHAPAVAWSWRHRAAWNHAWAASQNSGVQAMRSWGFVMAWSYVRAVGSWWYAVVKISGWVVARSRGHPAAWSCLGSGAQLGDHTHSMSIFMLLHAPGFRSMLLPGPSSVPTKMQLRVAPWISPRRWLCTLDLARGLGELDILDLKQLV